MSLKFGRLSDFIRKQGYIMEYPWPIHSQLKTVHPLFRAVMSFNSFKLLRYCLRFDSQSTSDERLTSSMHFERCGTYLLFSVKIITPRRNMSL